MVRVHVCVGVFVLCACVRVWVCVCMHVSGASKVEGTITDAKNITPSGMVYECEAQTACKARKDCKGYFKHRGYYDGYPTYHLLGPGTETWKKGSHESLVASVLVKLGSPKWYPLPLFFGDLCDLMGSLRNITNPKKGALIVIFWFGFPFKIANPKKGALIILW